MTFCLQHLYNDIHKMVIIFWNMQTLLFLCKYLVVFDDPPLYVPHLIAEIDSNLEQLP